MLFLFCLLHVASAGALQEKEVMIVASGETHAMLQPCDCQDNPGGGLAKRASLIAKLRDTNDIVLVDAGGFAGGGMYDSYTEGRRNDSLRTIATLRAMGYMKYDAVCIGDDDLQYGGLWLVKQAYYSKVPIISANCFYTRRKACRQPLCDRQKREVFVRNHGGDDRGKDIADRRFGYCETAD